MRRHHRHPLHPNHPKGGLSLSLSLFLSPQNNSSSLLAAASAMRKTGLKEKTLVQDLGAWAHRACTCACSSSCTAIACTLHAWGRAGGGVRTGGLDSVDSPPLPGSWCPSSTLPVARPAQRPVCMDPGPSPACPVTSLAGDPDPGFPLRWGDAALVNAGAQAGSQGGPGGVLAHRGTPGGPSATGGPRAVHCPAADDRAAQQRCSCLWFGLHSKRGMHENGAWAWDSLLIALFFLSNMAAVSVSSIPPMHAPMWFSPDPGRPMRTSKHGGLASMCWSCQRQVASSSCRSERDAVSHAF
jgi:hypothetical protein